MARLSRWLTVTAAGLLLLPISSVSGKIYPPTISMNVTVMVPPGVAIASLSQERPVTSATTAIRRRRRPERTDPQATCSSMKPPLPTPPPSIATVSFLNPFTNQMWYSIVDVRPKPNEAMEDIRKGEIDLIHEIWAICDATYGQDFCDTYCDLLYGEEWCDSVFGLEDDRKEAVEVEVSPS